MTKIRLVVSEQGIRGFTFTGHTGFAEHGSDIVCAAVSVLAQTAVIGLQEVVAVPCQVQIEDGYLSCELNIDQSDNEWDHCQVVLQTMYKGLTAIANENEYVDYISIEEVHSL